MGGGSGGGEGREGKWHCKWLNDLEGFAYDKRWERATFGKSANPGPHAVKTHCFPKLSARIVMLTRLPGGFSIAQLCTTLAADMNKQL